MRQTGSHLSSSQKLIRIKDEGLGLGHCLLCIASILSVPLHKIDEQCQR